jgi:hypothetical protein
MAENVRGQGNRDQNRNLQNENTSKVNRNRNQQSNLESGQSENISSQRSQRGSMGKQQEIERGNSSRSGNRQAMEE